MNWRLKRRKLLILGTLGLSLSSTAQGAQYDAPIIFESGSTTISKDTDTVQLPSVSGLPSVITVKNEGTEVLLDRMEFEATSQYKHILSATDKGKIVANGGELKSESISAVVSADGAGSEVTLNGTSVSGKGSVALADNGGKINLLGTSNLPIQLTSKDARGIVAQRGSQIEINHAVFTHDPATRGASAVSISDSSTASLKNMKITTLSVYGIIAQTGSHLEIDGVDLTHVGEIVSASAVMVGTNSSANIKNMNISTDRYGVFASNNSTVLFDQGTITTTDFQGFGLRSDNIGTVLTAKNTEIKTSGASGVGAYIYNGGTVNLENSTILTTGDAAHGTYVYGDSNLNIKNSTITTEKSDALGLVLNSHTSSFSTMQKVTMEDSIVTSAGDGIRHSNGNALIELSNSQVLTSGAVFSVTSTGNLQLDASAGSYLEGDVIVENGGSGKLLLDNSLWKGTTDSLTELSVKNNGLWDLTQNSAVHTLRLDSGGQVDFGSNPSRDYRSLTVDTLKGDGGTFLMRTNIRDDQGDRLVLGNSEAGSHTLAVTNNGSADVNGNETRLLVETSGAGLATFSLANKVELGAYEYDLRTVNGSGERNWELYASGNKKEPEISSTGNAGINIFTGSYLIHYVETNTLMQRMGELRDGSSKGSIWARTYGGEMKWDNDNRLKGFDVDYWGIQVGADKKIKLNNQGNLYVGGMFGYTNGSLDIYIGSGSIDSKSLGIYGAYKAPSEFYADLIFKYGWMKGDFSVRDTAGTIVKGKNIETDGFTVSMEIGQRIHFNKKKKQGWYVEPQAQLSFGHYSGDNFRATNGLHFDVDSYNSVLGRVGTNIGYEVKGGKNPINAYAKISMVHEFDGELNFKYNNSNESTDFGGTWLVYGVGITANVGKKHDLYLDLERSSGGNFTQKWAINAGYRFTW